MGARGAAGGAAHARPAPARDPTAPRQPRTRLQGPGMLEGIHPIAEPPARSRAGPAPLSEPVLDLRAEHGPRPSPKSALDPRERRARLSDRMDAGRSRRLRGWPARSDPRGPQRRGVLVSRVKQVAGSGVRESWGRRGRRSRGGPRWGGSKRSPRGGGRCCTRPGSPRRGLPGPGRRGSLRGTPRSYFRDPKPRSRDPFCPGVRTWVRTWRSSGGW